MRDGIRKPQKAYKNLDFLNSPDARTVRMLAEFLEPQARFRKESIKDTIVFFGSARIRPRNEARQSLQKVKKQIANTQRPSKALLQTLRRAQIQEDMSRYYEDCAELARLLTAWSKGLPEPNRFVVCSGGGPGIMEAANKGAMLAKGKSIGLNISIPTEQFANPYISEELNFEFHYFFIRKFWFVYLAKAMVIFPGGFGTMDELMEVLTLLQTNKIKKKMSVVMYGSDFWKKVINFDEMVQYGVISKKDIELFRFMDTPDDAFRYLKHSLTNNYPTK